LPFHAARICRIARSANSDMTGLDDLLKSMLPHDIAFAAGAIEHAGFDLFDVERVTLSGAVAKRRREFSAGRAYARAALAALACPPQPIPAAADRRPLWPGGFVGSISHCDHLCAAIVGRSAAYVGLGIDIEDDTPVEDGVRDIVCRPDEWRRVAATGLSTDAAKLLFVVKEAVFKAYYPATNAFLDFHEVSVELDEHSRSFKATLVAAEKPELADSRCFVGRVDRVDEHLIAVVAIARKAVSK
jgi:enterobactin synthetase component D / holo-[acyl-carrier protein] synthase